MRYFGTAAWRCVGGSVPTATSLSGEVRREVSSVFFFCPEIRGWCLPSPQGGSQAKKGETGRLGAGPLEVKITSSQAALQTSVYRIFDAELVAHDAAVIWYGQLLRCRSSIYTDVDVLHETVSTTRTPMMRRRTGVPSKLTVSHSSVYMVSELASEGGTRSRPSSPA